MAESLFTGFPGFIGARLLPRLLELRPESVFRCLVQQRFVGLAESQIAEIAKAHPETKGRITIVVGDITVPGLGLDAGEAKALAGRITGAYHLAAVYDLAVKKDAAQRINVDGTKNVLAFVREGRHFECLHYVSTAYVSGTAVGVFRESDLDVGQGFKNHYEETKFRAEVEVAKSGVPFVVYRPGVVVGDSKTGETAKFDGPYFALTAMTKLPSPGVFVRVGSGRSPINIVPVDFVIEALARLSTTGGNAGRTYHLTDPAPLTVFEVQELFARALGKSFVYLPVPLAAAKVMFAPGPVQRFLGMPVEHVAYFDQACWYDATEATRDLAALGIACPRLADYVPAIVAFFRARQGEVRTAAMV